MTSPLPVAFVLPDLGGGGAQAVMLQIAGGLDRALFDVRLLVVGGSQAFAARLPAHIRVEHGGARRLRDGLPWLLKQLRAGKPRIAVSVMGYLNLALLGTGSILPRTRIVVREANVLAATRSALPRWLPARALYQRLYPRAAAIVAPTAPIAGEIMRAAPRTRGRVHMIPNPVDIDALRTRAATPLRGGGAGLRLIAAGRLTRQKGYDRLIELVPQLPSDAQVTIYGEGPDRADLQVLIARLALQQRVTLAGFTDRLPAAVAGADAFLLPSRWEGLPNVVLESLAVGTPVIASQEAAVAEVAGEAPPGAVTIRPVDATFADAIRSLTPLSNAPQAPRPSLLPTDYAREAVVQRWQQLLTALADGSAP